MTDIEVALETALKLHARSQEGVIPSNLLESVQYSLLSPGKRIRPRLVLACAKMIGLPERAAMPAALAIEMVHCFTLIHDDLPCMDNDDFRRGRPSNHKKFGEALALLAGDALMALAVDTFLDAEPHVAPTCLARGLRRLSWAMGPRGVIGGQAAEALMSARSGLDQLREMHALKTGALFVASLMMPADLAGMTSPSGDVSKAAAIESFSKELGLAFQTADDLEDNESSVPSSILYFQSREEAGQYSLSRLEKASQTLSSIWGKSASHLTTFSDEIAKKIKNALTPSS